MCSLRVHEHWHCLLQAGAQRKSSHAFLLMGHVANGMHLQYLWHSPCWHHPQSRTLGWGLQGGGSDEKVWPDPRPQRVSGPSAHHCVIRSNIYKVPGLLKYHKQFPGQQPGRGGSRGNTHWPSSIPTGQQALRPGDVRHVPRTHHASPPRWRPPRWWQLSPCKVGTRTLTWLRSSQGKWNQAEGQDTGPLFPCPLDLTATQSLPGWERLLRT